MLHDISVNKKIIFLLFFLFVILFSYKVSATDISSCQSLSSGEYTLTANVSSSGTCFTISANNVVLDCNGYWINYAVSTTGYAIDFSSSQRKNVTIKNCNILQVASSSNSHGINVRSNAINVTLENINITTKGTWAVGIYLNAQNVSVKDVNIQTLSVSKGLYITNSINATFENVRINNVGNCIMLLGSTLIQHNHTFRDVYCEDLPILYTFNNNTNLNNVDFSSYGQVIWAGANSWVCNNCTFKNDGLLLSYITNSLINNSYIEATNAYALELASPSTNNVIKNTKIVLRSNMSSMIAIAINTNCISNTFENLEIISNLTSDSSSYGLYLSPNIGSNFFKNITMTANRATFYAIYMSSVSNHVFDKINVTTNVATRHIIVYGNNNYNVFNNSFFYNNASSSYFFYQGNAGELNFEIYNTVINDTLSTNEFYFASGSSGYFTLINTTANTTGNKVYIPSGSTIDFRKKWYISFYVFNNYGSPLANATVKVYNKFGALEGQVVSDENGKTPYIVTTEFKKTSSELINYTPHSIIATKEGYNSFYAQEEIRRSIEFYNILLISYIVDYPLPFYEEPTPQNNQIITKNFVTVNTSVRDYAWENSTNYSIYAFSDENCGRAENIKDNDITTGWCADGAGGNPYIIIDFNRSVRSSAAWFYVNPSIGVCGGRIEATDDPLSIWQLIGKVNDWGRFLEGWYLIDILNYSKKSFRYYKFVPYSRNLITQRCEEITPTGQTYEWHQTTLTAPGEIDTCILTWTSINYTMNIERITPDFAYCWLNMTDLADGVYNFFVTANDTEGNSGTAPQRNVIINTQGANLSFSGLTPANGSTIYRQDWIYVEVTGSEPIFDVILQWEKVGEYVDNYTMYNLTSEIWYRNMTLLTDGTYKFKVFARNSEDLWSSTEERIVFLVINPEPVKVTFIYPTPNNDALFTRDILIIRVGSNENIINVTLEWNKEINFSMKPEEGNLKLWNYTLDNLNDGVYYYKVYYVEESSNLSGQTEPRRIRISSSGKSFVFSWHFVFLFGILAVMALFAYFVFELDEKHNLLKLCFVWFILGLLTLFIKVLGIISNENLAPLSTINLLNTLFKISIYILIAFSFFMFVALFISIVNLTKQKRRQKFEDLEIE